MKKMSPEKLKELLRVFLVENAKLNLSALRTEETCWVGNILDSLALLEILPHLSSPVASNQSQVASRQSPVASRSLIDIGTGGGFPLLPIAISLPEWKCTGLDATRKKLDAISRISNALHLNNVELIWGRAEEIAKDNKYAGSFDVVTSRAVAPLKKLLPWCAPFAKPSGHIVLWKSLGIEEEVKEAESITRKLECTLAFTHKYTLPDPFGTRQLLMYTHA
jgi:16S rRNA (guanine527-N7)-methyltransferase